MLNSIKKRKTKAGRDTLFKSLKGDGLASETSMTRGRYYGNNYRETVQNWKNTKRESIELQTGTSSKA